ncbi:MAG: rRNA maturation RNase YbeY [Methylococcales bacterium]|nr:rRNA maturation RNase YbeY [Methylococcales bacterium]
MNIVEIQRICATDSQPNDAQLESWVNTVLANLDDDSEIVIRIVDEIESAQLNETYRHKQGATNILSFPVDVPDEIELNVLGDLVICAPVLEREATEQNKPLHNHWAHIVIHGTLHLLGYDHIEDTDAEEMETKEIALLQTLSIPNPYENGSDL